KNIGANPAVHVSIIRTISDQRAFSRSHGPGHNHSETMRHSGRYELAAILVCQRTWLNDYRNRAGVLHCSQNVICIINVGEPTRSKFDTKRLSRSCGRIKSVFSVRPIGMPQIVYWRLRLAQFNPELHVFSAQVCKNVAEAGDVAARG